MKSSKWTGILIAVLLFCCGAAAGALAHRYFESRVVNAKTAEDYRQHYVSEMKSNLKLTPEQVGQLSKILDETKAKYKAVRDRYRPEMLQVKAEQVERVKSILTAQQVPAYERLVAERERRAKEQDERDRQEEKRREAARRAQSGR